MYMDVMDIVMSFMYSLHDFLLASLMVLLAIALFSLNRFKLWVVGFVLNFRSASLRNHTAFLQSSSNYGLWCLVNLVFFGIHFLAITINVSEKYSIDLLSSLSVSFSRHCFFYIPFILLCLVSIEIIFNQFWTRQYNWVVITAALIDEYLPTAIHKNRGVTQW